MKGTKGTIKPEAKQYEEQIEGLAPNEDYETKHKVVNENTGEIIAEIQPSSVQPEAEKFGKPDANTVKLEKAGEDLVAVWNVDNVPDNGRPKSLQVSMFLYFTVVTQTCAPAPRVFDFFLLSTGWRNTKEPVRKFELNMVFDYKVDKCLTDSFNFS